MTVHPSMQGKAEATGRGIRCLHGCGVTFVDLDSWLWHLPVVHGHRSRGIASSGAASRPTPADGAGAVPAPVLPLRGRDGRWIGGAS